MDKKKVASLCLAGGIVVLLAAVIIRVGNIMLVFSLPIEGLWKLSVGLVLISIAFSVSKD